MLERGGIVAPAAACCRTAFHSICVHGDTPGAVAHARVLRGRLEGAGWRLVSLAEALTG